eukprot:scaffold915_cov65-Cylindrotheca_fusiformis.AAC.1
MTNSPSTKTVFGIRSALLLFTVASSCLVAIGNTRGLMLELNKAYGQTSSLKSAQNEKRVEKKHVSFISSSSSELNKAYGQATSLESAQNEKGPEKKTDTFSSSSSSESNEADGQATSLESALNEKRLEKNGIAFSSSKFRPNTTFPDSFLRDPLMEANPHQPVTIVVQLQGELGNMIYKIA